MDGATDGGSMKRMMTIKCTKPSAAKAATTP
jgi:hypothetical protein